MKKETAFEDKRIMRALDHLDEDLIDKASKRIKERPMGNTVTAGVSKKRLWTQISALAASLLLLSIAIPLASSMIPSIRDLFAPASGIEQSTTGNTEDEPAVPDEYFTTGNIMSWRAPGTGLEYEGSWIFTEDRVDPKRIMKYDPATNTVSSVCLDPSCSHSSDSCPLCSPSGETISFMDIFDDWLIYNFSTQNAKIHLYNLKTGETQVINEAVNPSYQVMDGIVYMSIRYTDPSVQEDNKTNRYYIASYDPSTRKVEYMFDVPEEKLFIGITNKRFIFVEKRNASVYFSPSKIWTTDYKGGDLKKNEALDFDPIILCGTYAYAALNADYETTGYNIRAYDLSTDSTFTIDIGERTKRIIADSGKLVFLTEDGNKIYITDARGENKTLIDTDLVYNNVKVVFEPYRIVGDYLMGMISSNKSNAGPSNGICALNLKTGEITPVPSLTSAD